MLSFLLLFICAITINLLGNYWVYTLKHGASSLNSSSTIFSLFNFLFLIGSLLRDILITSFLIIVLFKIINKKISLAETFYIVILAGFIFVAQNIFDLMWAYTHKNELSIEQILDFQSFSIYSCLKNVPSYLYYASITANLWELIYIFTLALLLKNKLNNTYPKSLGLVFLSYGVPLILWMIYVTFIQIAQA